MEIKLGIKALVGFIFAILLTIFGWYIIPELADILPILSLKAIFWVGIIAYWALAVVGTPILMMQGYALNWKGTLYGFFAFFSGYILSLVMYYTIGYIIEALDAVYPNSTFVTIGWIGVYMVWVLGMIVAPSYLVVKNAESDGGENDM